VFSQLLCKIFGHCPGKIIRHDEDTFSAVCEHCGKILDNNDLHFTPMSAEQKRKNAEFDAKFDAISDKIRANCARTVTIL